MKDILEKPVTVVYVKNRYLTKIDNIAARLKKMGVKILKKSKNHGMIFVNTSTRKFKGRTIDLEEVWKVEVWQ